MSEPAGERTTFLILIGRRAMTFMRENPWNHRKPTSTHHHWYSNIVELHLLTSNWVRETAGYQKTTAHQLKRVISPSIVESNPRFDRLLMQDYLPKDLEVLMDDSLPEELLSLLQNSIWNIQAGTLRNLFDKTENEEQSALRTLLEQTSWKTGRKCAQARWGNMPEHLRGDLRNLYYAFQDGPLSRYPESQKGFLIQRATSDEVLLELMSCPHQSTLPEVVKAADHLCLLHSFWARGFLYGLNSSTLLEYYKGKKKDGARCIFRWILQPAFANRVGHA